MIGQVKRSRLGLGFLLDFTAKPVGVAEADLYFAQLCGRQVADVGFAYDRRRKIRLPLGRIRGIAGLRLPEALQIVDDPRGCGAKKPRHEQ